MSFRFKVGIIVVLLLLTASAFFIRWNNACQSEKATVDEWIYFGLARQLVKNPLNYQSRDVTAIIQKDSPDLPIHGYMTQPLFKHPPLFSYLLAAAFKLLGDDGASLYAVPVFFGVLMIPLGYLLGRLFYGEIVGLATAFFLWMDPVHIISSQKVWPDTTLNFFVVLAIYLFACAVKYSRDQYFFWAGISTGLALLTKYTGVLALAVMILYALIESPSLLRNRKFLWSLLIPVAMMLPWGYWNYAIYGQDFINTHFMVEHNLKLRAPIILLIGLIIVTGFGFILQVWRSWQGKFEEDKTESADLDEESPSRLRTYITFFLCVMFIYVMKDSIVNSLNIYKFPQTSWGQDTHFRSHPLFYFRQLIEFSFIYFFAFMSFFMVTEENYRKGMLLHLTVVVIMVFHLLWGSYQCRYILGLLPFLIIAGVVAWMDLWTRCREDERVLFRRTGQTILIILAVYILVKVNYLNFLISYPNDMCYF